MRMYLNGFEEEVTLRLARLDLVRSEWRRYQFEITEGPKGLQAANIMAAEQ